MDTEFLAAIGRPRARYRTATVRAREKVKITGRIRACEKTKKGTDSLTVAVR